METPKVSVIIPVYNTGPFLETTLLSVKNQTLKEIEIIIIDDGSTDESTEIIRGFAEIDSRVTVFTQENAGLSSSRNKGIDNATGAFIYFMDSDDIIEPDTLELCYDACIINNLDIVCFDAIIFSEEVNTSSMCYTYQRTGSIDENRIYTGIELMEGLTKENIFRASVCLYLTKRVIITKSKIKFLPGILHEDELYTPQLLLLCKRVSYISRSFFHRRVRSGSIMTTNFSDRNVSGYMIVVDQLLSKFRNGDDRAWYVIEKRVYSIVNSIAYNACKFPMKKKIRILCYLISRKILRLLTAKNFTIFIFPYFIILKTKLVKPLQRYRYS